MSKHTSEFIPFGFQYYREPTPFRTEWDHDLRQISQMGFNTVKYWVQWRASHPAPDSFKYIDIEELMDIALKYNLKVILNVIFDVAPVWIYKTYPDCKMITADGAVIHPGTLCYRQIGGGPGPCYHHDESNLWKLIFLSETVKRFKDHPALLCWDLWNEPELTTGVKRDLSFGNQVCYCENSINKFHQWLKKKYVKIENLNYKWQMFYYDWHEVEAPRYQGVFNNLIDWRLFFRDTLVEEFRSRIETVRKLDTENTVMCHSVPPPVFNLITAGSDDFMLAELSEVVGSSLGSSKWASDLYRSASKGKNIWISEIHAMPGSMAYKPQKLELKELKRHVLTPLSRGVSGFLFWQYRAEILGLEGPAWGAANIDGSKTPWLEDMSVMNKQIQKNRELILKAEKTSDGMAILLSSECQIANFGIYGDLDIYFNTCQGIHKILNDLNYRVDIISSEGMDAGNLENIKCLWLPYPVYMDGDMCNELKEWINNGGILVSECSFGSIIAENGTHSIITPGYGFDKVFGIREKWIRSVGKMENSYSSFAVREGNSLIKAQTVGSSGDETEICLGMHLISEVDIEDDVQVLAYFSENGMPAVTSRKYGRGKAILISTLVGACYWQNPLKTTRDFVSEILESEGLRPYIRADAQEVRVDTLELKKDEEIKEVLVFVENIGETSYNACIHLEDTFLSITECWYEGSSIWIEDGRLNVRLVPGEIQVVKCLSQSK